MLSKRVPRDSFAHFTEKLQAHGKYTFTKQQAMHELQISDNAFRKATSRLGRQKRLMRIANNFYAIVPFEYQLSQGLPPTSYIDALMKFREQPYYVGVLSAAALHGAAHQSPQELQVVTSHSLNPIRAGRGKIRFLKKKKIEKIPTQRINTPTGYLKASTPEATALDLLLYVRAAGHLNNVATILEELSEKIDPKKLAEAAQAGYDLSIVQRLGFLLDRFTEEKPSGELFQWLKKQEPEYTPLRTGTVTDTSERDEKWRVIVNEEVESDL